jgi:RNA polymerase sigma-70 factor
MNGTVNRTGVWAKAIVEQNHRWLAAYFLAATGKPDAAEDLVQEVFTEALANADRFDETKSFGAWLRGIAKNILLEHYRKTRHRFVALDESVLDQLNYAATDSESLHAAPGYSEGRVEALKTCMNALTERSRSALELKYGQRMLSRQIAEQIGMKVTAVDMLISRARKMLEVCITQKMRSV